MEDIYKSKEGDRDSEIKKVGEAIAKNEETLDRAATKLVNDELDKDSYGRLKERIVKENFRLKSQIVDLKTTETGYQEYSRYGLSMLANLSKCYEFASFEYKQRIIGLMFPEKLVFENQTFQTTEPNTLLTLCCNTGRASSDCEKEKSGKNAAQSCLVTALGFKPKTPSSVVRYSIQLSYAAISLLGLQK